jgi:RNA polymerase primary sigma factor
MTPKTMKKLVSPARGTRTRPNGRRAKMKPRSAVAVKTSPPSRVAGKLAAAPLRMNDGLLDETEAPRALPVAVAALAPAAAADGQEEGIAESVAELEAVADEEEEETPEPQETRDADEPSNFLGLYFKEMARLSVLRPEEEFESARKIEELEIRLWTQLLAHAPLTDHLLKVVERTLENSLPEFKPLRKLAADYRRKPTRPLAERLVQAALKAGERIRAIDIDKTNLDLCFHELRKIARGLHGRVVNDKITFNPGARQFRDHYKQAASTYGAIQRAKNEFVKANLRLVVSIARRFNHGRMPLSDLIQEGNIGLIKAVERFDYRRGYRFSTYASWWIRHAISRALADKGRAVRLPVHMIDAYHRVARSKRELSSKLGRTPTTEELGEATGIAAAKIEKMRSYLLDQSFSLDRPVSDEDGRKFIDFIQDPNAETAPTDRLVEAAMSTEVRSLLEHLKPMEADILRQRFGLDTDKELTLKEIGEKYNLSRERIRQLQEQALLKMRRALQRKDMM